MNQTQEKLTWHAIAEAKLDSEFDQVWCIRDNNGRLIADLPEAPDSGETAHLIAAMFNNRKRESIMTREGLCELYKQVIGYNPDLDPAGKSDWTESEMLETLKEAFASGRIEGAVYVHGWRWIDGSQEHWHNTAECHGFCVYTRIETPADIQQPFDLSNELDFDTLEEALNNGQARADALGLELRDY
jgi:hypothetical protein